MSYGLRGKVFSRYSPEVCQDERMTNPKFRIGFAGGYSAGHIVPGVALSQIASGNFLEAEVFSLISEDKGESVFVSDPFAKVLSMPAGRLDRESRMGYARAALSVLSNAVKCRRRLKKARIKALVVSGSFVSTPCALAAKTMALPVAVLEPNASLGLANRWNAVLADRIWVSGLYGPNAKSRKIERTGVPIRAEFGPPRDEPRAMNSKTDLTVAILGGSRGHDLLFREVPNLLEKLQKDKGWRIQAVHIAGIDGEVGRLRTNYRRNGIDCRVEAYRSDLPSLIERADFVITSAGAVTLSEIAYLGIPGLIVPLAHAAEGHQVRNARRFAAKTGCVVVEEESWKTERVAEQVDRLWRDEERMRDCSRQLLQYSNALPGNAYFHLWLKNLIENA